MRAKIKREHMAENETVDGRVDEALDDDGNGLTREVQRMKCALGLLDQNFDSDDDDDKRNPYVPSVSP